MKWKLLNDAAQKTYALIFESGDEVMSNLTSFAKENNLHASQFTAIGAFENAELAYFDVDKKKYNSIPVKEQVEVLSLNGDIAIHENKPVVHAHVVLGKADGSTVGGHLKKAVVRPTLEVILNESPSFLQKKIDLETGLALISF